MARKALPRNVMRKAVENRKIEDFIWACLDLACVELKEDNNNARTFSGRDIQAFLDHLLRMEKDKRDRGEEVVDGELNKKILEVDAWVKKAR
jgi:hypothetical protein